MIKEEVGRDAGTQMAALSIEEEGKDLDLLTDQLLLIPAVSIVDGLRLQS